MTCGLSPAALRLAFEDWFVHLSHNPAQLADLSSRWWSPPSAPAVAAVDRRFRDPAWQDWPFNLYMASFLRAQSWWHDATTDVSGVSAHHQEVVSFAARQWLDMLCPANFLWTNPSVLRETARTAGANLRQGQANFADDVRRALAPPGLSRQPGFEVGRNLAVTPGQVIYRNHLIELIQYAPASGQVWPEPILLVPAWIMKYYILDLSPQDSLVAYLVGQGHTVFAVSWINPGAQDRNLGMDDYLRDGVMAAIGVVGTVVPGQKIHATGYCLGGTLLSIAAAAMGRDGDDRLKTVTMLAAQTDFTEAGELGLFIDDSQVSFLEDVMWDKGYLDSTQMAGAFQLISSNDLVWSRAMRDYLMGDRAPASDLMAWNADGTRLPYRMHSEYLRGMFLHNDLADGRYRVGGGVVALGDIRCPVFCVGTARDHVAPWRSVYKLHRSTCAPITFLLTSGGHNVGIVNPPGVAGRSYQVMTRAHEGRTLDPEAWLEAAPHHEGSWWPAWAGWLQAHGGAIASAPAMGAADHGYAPICAAPGTYVLMT